jgi:hypothetical protein
MDEDIKKCTDRVTTGQGLEFAHEVVVSVSGGMVVGISYQGDKSYVIPPKFIVVDHDNRREDGKGVNPFEWPDPICHGIFVLYVDGIPVFASRSFEEIDGELDKLPHDAFSEKYRIAFCYSLDFVPNVHELLHMAAAKDKRLDE